MRSPQIWCRILECTTLSAGLLCLCARVGEGTSCVCCVVSPVCVQFEPVVRTGRCESCSPGETVESNVHRRVFSVRTHGVFLLLFPVASNDDVGMVPPHASYFVVGLCRTHQLVQADPVNSTCVLANQCCLPFREVVTLSDSGPAAHRYLACGLLVRGSVQVSDVQRNIERCGTPCVVGVAISLVVVGGFFFFAE